MLPRSRVLLIWAPRLVGLATTAFLALFALDAFDGRPLLDALPAFALHLIPAATVGTVVGVGWRFPWAGAAGFAALAAGYAAIVPTRLDWILLISGPLALTAVLFAAQALVSRPSRDPRSQSIV